MRKWGGRQGRLGETPRPDTSLTPSEGETKGTFGESVLDCLAAQGSFHKAIRESEP